MTEEEHKSKSNKKYYEKNKERLCELKRKKYKDNQEKEIIRNKNKYDSEYYKKYYKNNKEKYKNKNKIMNCRTQGKVTTLYCLNFCKKRNVCELKELQNENIL